MQSRPLLGIALALAAAGGYGFAPPLVRLGFESGVPGWESALLRATALIAVFGAIALVMRIPLAVPRGGWPAMTALAASTVVVSLSYLASVQYIPVGLAVIIFYTFPFMVLFASPLLEGRPIGLFRLGLAGLAFAGLTFAIGPGFGDLDPRGILLALAAALGAAGQLFAARALSDRMTPLAFGLVVHVLVWPVLLAAALWWSGGALRLFVEGAVAAPGYAAVALVGALYVVTYFFHMKCLSYAPASTVAPFFNLEPVVSLAVAALLLGERLAAHQYAGAAMVLTALVLAGLESRFVRPAPAGKGTAA